MVTNALMKLVQAANEVHTNVWGVVVLSGGIILCCCHQPTVGTTLIGGGFALINPGSKTNEKVVNGN